MLPPLNAITSNPTLPRARVASLLRFLDFLKAFVLYAIFAFVLWLSFHPSFYYLVWFPVIYCTAIVVALAHVAQLLLDFLGFRYEVTVSRRIRFPQNLALALLAIWGVSIFARIPLRLAFLTAWPALNRAIDGQNPATFPGLSSDILTPLFKIDADSSNSSLTYSRAQGYNTNRILLFLADDHECAFIYSPEGIDNLAYNSGAAGHLFGPWYWMAED